MRLFGLYPMKKRNLLISLLFLVFSSASTLAEHAKKHFPTLRSAADSQLQRQLEDRLDMLGLHEAVARKQLSVALVDITDKQHPRLAAVNGDEMKYAASLPKIAILLGAFVEIERGSLELDDATRESLTKMIRVSSNREATRMLNEVGKDRLVEILQSPELRLYDAAGHGGLWVGKEYGKSPAYHRDPLHNLSHGATAFQAARFYYLLETGQLASPALTRQMKSMLGDPAIKHKFVKGLQSRPTAEIYRKSGTWRHFHADSALVEDGGHKYIVVAIAQHKDGGRWLSRMAAPLHDLIVPTQVAQADD
jgi:beta-lactamase class A